MGIGQVSPDGYVAPSINPANLLCTIFCICACIGTYLYLQYKEKYNKRRNEEYEKGMPNNRGRPASKEKREDLEKMLKEMQVQVLPVYACA